MEGAAASSSSSSQSVTVPVEAGMDKDSPTDTPMDTGEGEQGHEGGVGRAGGGEAKEGVGAAREVLSGSSEKKGGGGEGKPSEGENTAENQITVQREMCNLLPPSALPSELGECAAEIAELNEEHEQEEQVQREETGGSLAGSAVEGAGDGAQKRRRGRPKGSTKAAKLARLKELHEQGKNAIEGSVEAQRAAQAAVLLKRMTGEGTETEDLGQTARGLPRRKTALGVSSATAALLYRDRDREPSTHASALSPPQERERERRQPSRSRSRSRDPTVGIERGKGGRETDRRRIGGEEGDEEDESVLRLSMSSSFRQKTLSAAAIAIRSLQQEQAASAAAAASSASGSNDDLGPLVPRGLGGRTAVEGSERNPIGKPEDSGRASVSGERERRGGGDGLGGDLEDPLEEFGDGYGEEGDEDEEEDDDEGASASAYGYTYTSGGPSRQASQTSGLDRAAAGSAVSSHSSVVPVLPGAPPLPPSAYNPLFPQLAGIPSHFLCGGPRDRKISRTKVARYYQTLEARRQLTQPEREFRNRLMHQGKARGRPRKHFPSPSLNRHNRERERDAPSSSSSSAAAAASASASAGGVHRLGSGSFSRSQTGDTGAEERRLQHGVKSRSPQPQQKSPGAMPRSPSGSKKQQFLSKPPRSEAGASSGPEEGGGKNRKPPRSPRPGPPSPSPLLVGDSSLMMPKPVLLRTKDGRFASKKDLIIEKIKGHEGTGGGDERVLSSLKRRLMEEADRDAERPKKKKKKKRDEEGRPFDGFMGGQGGKNRHPVHIDASGKPLGGLNLFRGGGGLSSSASSALQRSRMPIPGMGGAAPQVAIGVKAPGRASQPGGHQQPGQRPPTQHIFARTASGKFARKPQNQASELPPDRGGPGLGAESTRNWDAKVREGMGRDRDIAGGGGESCRSVAKKKKKKMTQARELAESRRRRPPVRPLLRTLKASNQAFGSRGEDAATLVFESQVQAREVPMPMGPVPGVEIKRPRIVCIADDHPDAENLHSSSPVGREVIEGGKGDCQGGGPAANPGGVVPAQFGAVGMGAFK
uniref:Uncharacterized protein n=1 Tax=Chromera velia CCMP2878 TaxID=1169474 RepID=A0A0G4HJT6_9ALVE|eukprot:Cvel_1103.t1-p1 / transcript=Cvel_1103.t1 / gene=Cvel_1103 / organism=Chromera_velia_CCMP2878 / gene_product=hypothetical protein / transcript_product=hypothetical protein / location=Cvel_scaffold36:33833-38273(-) / protein_length=1041 / sequence_SO=supercontig / SO=protein_coding / is_pseudo=false